MSFAVIANFEHFERGAGSSKHGRAHPVGTLPRGSNEKKTTRANLLLEDMLNQAVGRNFMLLTMI